MKQVMMDNVKRSLQEVKEKDNDDEIEDEVGMDLIPIEPLKKDTITKSQFEILVEKNTEEIKAFHDLLKEKNIGIFALFEKELSTLIYDSRYNKLHHELRKYAFDEYVKKLYYKDKEKEKEKVISSNKINTRKINQDKMKKLLKSLIEKGELTITTSFSEFQKKYEDNPIFQDTISSDREFLFNEAKLRLKKLLEESKRFL